MRRVVSIQVVKLMAVFKYSPWPPLPKLMVRVVAVIPPPPLLMTRFVAKLDVGAVAPDAALRSIKTLPQTAYRVLVRVVMVFPLTPLPAPQKAPVTRSVAKVDAEMLVRHQSTHAQADHCNAVGEGLIQFGLKKTMLLVVYFQWSQPGLWQSRLLGLLHLMGHVMFPVYCARMS